MTDITLKGDDGSTIQLQPVTAAEITLDLADGPSIELAGELVGPKGDQGVGLPTGGSTNQVLAKSSGASYDFQWISPSGVADASAGAKGIVQLAGDLGGTAALPRVPGLKAAYVQLAANPDSIIFGTITRDANEAATAAPVIWPDGTVGTYTATSVSSAFPGAVDAYAITYAGSTTVTYTQPTVTRDANGAVTSRPALVVS